MVRQGRLSISLPCSATEELPNFNCLVTKAANYRNYPAVGIAPPYLTLPCLVKLVATAGDSVNVVPREQLISSTTYYYNATVVPGDATVIVQGSITTPQYSKYLRRLPPIVLYHVLSMYSLCGRIIPFMPKFAYRIVNVIS